MQNARRPRMAARWAALGVVALLCAALAGACGTADGVGSGAVATNTSATAASPTANGTPACRAAASPAPGVASATDCEPAISHPTGADELVLRVDMAGGLVPADLVVTELPLFSLYGDGHVITTGPQIAIYPAPALPSLQVTPLTEAGIQAVLRAARDAGLLDGDKTWDAAGASDAPTTTFTINANGGTTVVAVYALGLNDEQPGMSAEEVAARKALESLTHQLGNLRGWLAASDIAGDDVPYTFTRLQVVSQPVDDSALSEPGVAPGQQDWPLATPLSDFGRPYTLLNSRCGVVDGADLDALLPLLNEANQLTRWQSAEQNYILYLRPVLPDETGCPVAGQSAPPA